MPTNMKKKQQQHEAEFRCTYVSTQKINTLKHSIQAQTHRTVVKMLLHQPTICRIEANTHRRTRTQQNHF